MARKWDSATVGRCIEMYKAGWSVLKVAEHTGVPSTTIRGWLNAQGIKIRKRNSYATGRRDHKMVDRVIQLYKDGLCTKEIGDMLGYHKSAIEGLLQDAGVPRRSPSEALKAAYARGRRLPNNGHTNRNGCMRPLMIQFKNNDPHPKGPEGPELPYIYAPEHNRIFVGPANTYHWDLIQHTPELRSAYGDDNYKNGAPFQYAPEGHIHGRILWNPKKMVAYNQQAHPREVLEQLAQALKVAPPEPVPDWSTQGDMWDDDDPSGASDMRYDEDSGRMFDRESSVKWEDDVDHATAWHRALNKREASSS